MKNKLEIDFLIKIVWCFFFVFAGDACGNPRSRLAATLARTGRRIDGRGGQR